MTSYKKGIVAEVSALIFLWLKGYRILKWRYKTKVGEIDIIAKRGSLIAFVEVKKRITHEKGLDAVTEKSRRRIENAAYFYLQNRPIFQRCELRFVVISVSCGFWPKHLKKAWIFGE